jgi:hypothetical protein
MKYNYYNIRIVLSFKSLHFVSVVLNIMNYGSDILKEVYLHPQLRNKKNVINRNEDMVFF